MVHTSMRAVDARAPDVIDALKAVVGEGGALLFLVCAPEGLPFDPATSPAWDGLGVLPEVFRQSEGVVLSDHPVARFGAWGTGEGALVSTPPLDDYFRPGSPLERLIRRGGRVLRLAADTNSTTLLHYADYRLAHPEPQRVTHRVIVAGPEGPSELAASCIDDDEGVRPWTGGEDYFSAIMQHARDRGLVSARFVGSAWSELVDAAPLVDLGVAWMAENLD